MKSRSQGFTLIELMVVLSIAAAVLVIGVPNFNRFRLNNRLTNVANDMLGATVLARTEAIKRQVTVALCPSANPTAAEPTCTANSTVGWIVFEDSTANCERDSGETLIDGRGFDNDIVTNPLKVKYDGNCLAFSPTGFRKEYFGQDRAEARDHVRQPRHREAGRHGGLIRTRHAHCTHRPRSDHALAERRPRR